MKIGKVYVRTDEIDKEMLGSDNKDLMRMLNRMSDCLNDMSERLERIEKVAEAPGIKSTAHYPGLSPVVAPSSGYLTEKATAAETVRDCKTCKNFDDTVTEWEDYGAREDDDYEGN